MQSSSATRFALAVALAISLPSTALAIPVELSKRCKDTTDPIPNQQANVFKASDGGLSTGAIIGIVFSIFGGILVGAVAYYILKSKQPGKTWKSNPFNDATVWIGGANPQLYDDTPARPDAPVKPAAKVVT